MKWTSSVVNTKVTEANTALTAEVGDLKADMQKIADALTEDVSKVLILDQRGRRNSGSVPVTGEYPIIVTRDAWAVREN